MALFQIIWDIPFILTLFTLVTGLISLIDRLFLARNRASGTPPSPFVSHAKSLFPIFLTVLLVRSFLIQPYRVPTGSLEPTIMPGDFILVNQFAYGLRLPVLNTKIVEIGKPRRGDIVLFRYPCNPWTIFVKRVIGLPGDHIIYRNKILTINGKIAAQTDPNLAMVTVEDSYRPIESRWETLDEVTHQIFVQPLFNLAESVDIIVPPESYFMMGDNRDNSNDSRAWGVVNDKYLIGKAFAIWMSWDHPHKKIRWHRIGNKLQ